MSGHNIAECWKLQKLEEMADIKKCSFCGMERHDVTSCWQLEKEKKIIIRGPKYCVYCKTSRHTVSECWKLQKEEETCLIKFC